MTPGEVLRTEPWATLDKVLRGRGYRKADGLRWVRNPDESCEDVVVLGIRRRRNPAWRRLSRLWRGPEEAWIDLYLGRWDLYRARAALTGETLRSSPFVYSQKPASHAAYDIDMGMYGHGKMEKPKTLVQGALALEERWFPSVRSLADYLDFLSTDEWEWRLSEWAPAHVAIGWWLLGDRKRMLDALRDGGNWVRDSMQRWWLPGDRIRTFGDLATVLKTRSPSDVLGTS